jgi:hypothetical protein
MAPKVATWKNRCDFNSVTYRTGASIYTTNCKDVTVNPPPPLNSDVSGTCPSYRATCSSNLNSDIENTFGTYIVPGQLIDATDLIQLYNLGKRIANNRVINTPPIAAQTIKESELINKDHFNVLRSWAITVVSTLGNISYVRTGDLIEVNDFMEMKNKFLNIATLCNTNGFSSCPHVCNCNTVCTCNCNSNY